MSIFWHRKATPVYSKVVWQSFDYTKKMCEKFMLSDSFAFCVIYLTNVKLSAKPQLLSRMRWKTQKCDQFVRKETSNWRTVLLFLSLLLFIFAGGIGGMWLFSLLLKKSNFRHFLKISVNYMLTGLNNFLSSSAVIFFLKPKKTLRVNCQ